MTNAHWTKITCLFVFLLALASPASAQSRKVNIAYTATSPYQAPLIIAREAGFFKKHGLDVSPILTPGGSLGFQAMLGGDVAMVLADGSAAVRFDDAGFHPIAARHSGDGHLGSGGGDSFLQDGKRAEHQDPKQIPPNHRPRGAGRNLQGDRPESRPGKTLPDSSRHPDYPRRAVPKKSQGQNLQAGRFR